AWHSIRVAEASIDAAKLSVGDTKRTIALGVANALVAVVTAERIAELNRVGFRAALERLALTRRKLELRGGAQGLDGVRAPQAVEQARATLVSGDESLRQAREALGLALGLSKAVGVSKELDMTSLERGVVAVCKPAGNLDERADIALARQR